MKILMLGWEYPPKISGGLGIASQGLARSLVKAGHVVHFLLPTSASTSDDEVQLINASDIQPTRKHWEKIEIPEKKIIFKELGARLIPYLGIEHFQTEKSQIVQEKQVSFNETLVLLKKIKLTGTYGDLLIDEVLKFAFLASQYAEQHDFDMIHCHDWMTFKAGQAIREQKKIPLVCHFHSTESERNGPHAHEAIAMIERMGAAEADLVVTVSEKTARLVRHSYHIPKKKIGVIPNGYSENIVAKEAGTSSNQCIGFIGRLTQQKHPKKFLDIARLLSNLRTDLSFVMIGDGDQMETIRSQITSQNLENKIELTGFLSHAQTLKRLSALDLLIVPSHEEPFGMVPLESIRAKVPVICSEGCGISEFIPSLKTNRGWDDHSWVLEIQKLLNDVQYREHYAEQCFEESNQLSWNQVGKVMIRKYQSLLEKKDA